MCPKFCRGFLEIVQLLIDNGAKVNTVDKGGHTVLDIAFDMDDEFEGKPKFVHFIIYRRFPWERLPKLNMPLFYFLLFLLNLSIRFIFMRIICCYNIVVFSISFTILKTAKK